MVTTFRVLVNYPEQGKRKGKREEKGGGGGKMGENPPNERL